MAAAAAGIGRPMNTIEEHDPKHLLHFLNSFTSPTHRSIQPAVYGKEITKSTVAIPAAVGTGMKLPLEADFGLPYPTGEFYSLPVNVREFIINPNLAEGVKEEYTAETKAGDVPVYMFILTNFGHASVIIYYGGTLYSVGLVLEYGSYAAASGTSQAVPGSLPLESLPKSTPAATAAAPAATAAAPASVPYVGRPDFIAEALIASPDHLVTPAKLRKRNGVDKPFDYKIVDMGLFKKKHMDRILAVLTDASKEIQFLFEPEGQFNSIQIKLNKTYSLLSSKMTVEQWQAYNCISFAQQVFAERVSCARPVVGIVDPAMCKSKIIKKEDIKSLFVEYMRKYEADEPLDSLFATLNNECSDEGSCAIMGGSRTRRSSRKARRSSRKARRRVRKN
jgi:hypothetical protein